MTTRRDVVFRWVLASVLFGVTALVAGCGIELPSSSSAPSATPGAGSSTGNPPDGQAPGQGGAGQGGGGPAPPNAADGTNLQACVDGSCEVRLDGPARLPLDPRFQLPNFRVSAIGQGNVTIESDWSGGSTSTGDCDGGSCSVSISSGSADEPGQLTATMSGGSQLQLPTLSVRVVALDHGTAVLRLSAG